MQERAWGRGHATPPLVGIGYRQDLWPWIDSHPHEIDCLEITAEHFFGPNTRVRLHSLANAYPLIIHGLGLSLGSPGPLDEHLLDLFAGVVKDANPLWISDHLSFTRTSEIEFGHFNPICPNRENVGLIADHVREVVETCGKPLLLENITTSLRVRGSLSETEFLNRVCEAADCGLLLDVTNLFVNSRNHDFDPYSWLHDIDSHRIAQLHVVGYEHSNARWHDTHREGIQSDLWELIHTTLEYASVQAAIIERDENFPKVDEFERELQLLKRAASIATNPRDSANRAQARQ